MPVMKSKQPVWKCIHLTCDFEMSKGSKDELKDNGFEHHKSQHNLVEQNRDWYMTHVHNFFTIS